MRFAAVLVFASFLAAGCATSRNYQPDIDALNAKVDALQTQLQAKNKEIGALNDQLRSLQSQLDAARRDKSTCESRLAGQGAKSGYDKSASPQASDPYAK